MDPVVIIIIIIICAPVLVSVRLAVTLCSGVSWLHALVPLAHTAAVAAFALYIKKQPSNTGDATPGVLFVYLFGFLVIHAFFILPAALLSLLVSRGVYNTASFALMMKTILLAGAMLTVIVMTVPLAVDALYRFRIRHDIATSEHFSGSARALFLGRYSLEMPVQLYPRGPANEFYLDNVGVKELPSGHTKERYFNEHESYDRSFGKKSEALRDGRLETNIRGYKTETGEKSRQVIIMAFYNSPGFVLGMRGWGLEFDFHHEHLEEWHERFRRVVMNYHAENKKKKADPANAFFLPKGCIDTHAIMYDSMSAFRSFRGPGVSGSVSVETGDDEMRIKRTGKMLLERFIFPWVVWFCARYGDRYEWVGRMRKSFGREVHFIRYGSRVLDTVPGREMIVRSVDHEDRALLYFRWNGYDKKNRREISCEMECEPDDMGKHLQVWDLMLGTFRSFESR